jgi:hypothetical protein
MCDVGEKDGCKRPFVVRLFSLAPQSRRSGPSTGACWPCYSDMILGHTPLESKRQRARYEVKKASGDG